MRAYLVRIGVDQAFGGWNSPMNPETNAVPTPESRPMRTEFATPYALVQPALVRFEGVHRTVPTQHVRLPKNLIPANMHLDPDFQHLTYGDSGTRRGKGLTDLAPGDVVAFYSGLKPVGACKQQGR